MTDSFSIGGGLTATIRADGAELVSLVDASGREMMWEGGPLWPAHSPVLFPIVGQVAGDTIEIDGAAYPMTRHGFARRRRFAWGEQATDRCTLTLVDDEQTRSVFPFAFHLGITYRVDGTALHVGYTLRNTGAVPLPASLGAHPAFRWPLVDGTQTDYRIEFDEAEPDPIHRLDAGLLDPQGRPTPIDGDRLDLDPALFEADAIIMLAPRSRALRYVGPGGGLAFSWSGFPQLGVWQKPAADFVCIEPWHGYSSPSDWHGEFADKPGLLIVAPGESRTMGWTVQPIDGDA